jgi:excisionase family DNA binding protein
MSQLLTTDEAAERLGFKNTTLQQWRWAGRGPNFVKFGHYVRYRSDDLDEWVKARPSFSSTSEVTAHGKA